MPPVRLCSATAARYDGRLAGGGVEEGGRVGEREALQPYVVDGVATFEPVEQPGDRVAPHDLVGPVRAEDQSVALEIGDALEQGDALRVGPVQVLEDHDGRPARGHGLQDLQPGPEALDLGAVGVGQDLELFGIDALPAVQCGQKEFERSAECAGLRLADEHDGPVLYDAHEFLHEPGLADARLASQDRDTGAGRADELRQPAQLVLASDHHGAKPSAA